MKLLSKPAGVFLIGIFLLLSVVILETAGISLLFPGTFLDRMWALNPNAYAQMANYKSLIGSGFVILGIIFMFADIGWFKRRKWGWWLVISIFLVNGISDGARLLTGDIAGGVIGLCVAGALLFYLTRPKIRQLFRRKDKA